MGHAELGDTLFNPSFSHAGDCIQFCFRFDYFPKPGALDMLIGVLGNIVDMKQWTELPISDQIASSVDVDSIAKVLGLPLEQLMGHIVYSFNLSEIAQFNNPEDRNNILQLIVSPNYLCLTGIGNRINQHWSDLVSACFKAVKKTYDSNLVSVVNLSLGFIFNVRIGGDCFREKGGYSGMRYIESDDIQYINNNTGFHANYESADISCEIVNSLVKGYVDNKEEKLECWDQLLKSTVNVEWEKNCWKFDCESLMKILLELSQKYISMTCAE